MIDFRSRIGLDFHNWEINPRILFIISDARGDSAIINIPFGIVNTEWDQKICSWQNEESRLMVEKERKKVRTGGVHGWVMVEISCQLH